jgi:CDP-2,3-bis-(O-geranylgeranyl)-sn-glycerol synthase
MNPAALVQAAFLLLAMSVAGAAHVLWLRSSWSRRFAWPVDGGLTFRGKRLFGENKRVCGFMVLPPVAALMFMLLGGTKDLLPPTLADGLWPLGAWQYAGLGLVCGLAFMLAELPNSFIKRRLDIAPGQAPQQAWLRPLVLVVDRYDSVLGVLLALSWMVPVSLATWFWVLVLGPLVHAVFSIAMHSLGIKARAL